MGRLVPAGTGMEFYRRTKIAGEDVVEEPTPELTLDAQASHEKRSPPAVSWWLIRRQRPDEILAE